MSVPTAFLFDVDDTLLDNDRFGRDLGAALDNAVGAEGTAAYWAAFEARRRQSGYADYLGALQDGWEASGRDLRWIGIGDFLLGYPFAERLYPKALQVLRAFAEIGPTWLISDGDGIMQPRKLRQSGLWDAVEGRVRIYVHKETRLSEIEAQCPAGHYVMIDDKLRILDAIKARWGGRVTTIQPRQGHYAAQAAAQGTLAAPDIAIDHIGDLIDHPFLADLA